MAMTLVFVLYCFEAGLFFTVAPWTRFWSMNPLLHYTTAIGALADSGYLRGFVSGIGLIHLVLGARQLGQLVIENSSKGKKK